MIDWSEIQVLARRDGLSPREIARRLGISRVAVKRALAAVRPPDRLLLGTAISNLSRKFGLTNADFEALEDVRDKTPAEPMRF